MPLAPQNTLHTHVLYNLVLGLGGWLLAHNHLLPLAATTTQHTLLQNLCKA